MIVSVIPEPTLGAEAVIYLGAKLHILRQSFLTLVPEERVGLSSPWLRTPYLEHFEIP